jgi:hypothetical protein
MIFEDLSKVLKSDKNYLSKFKKTSLRIIIRMRNVSEQSCGEGQNTHFIFNTIPTPENRALMTYCGKNIVEQATDDN